VSIRYPVRLLKYRSEWQIIDDNDTAICEGFGNKEIAEYIVQQLNLKQSKDQFLKLYKDLVPKIKHVCGLQGFQRGIGWENDICPACEENRKERYQEPCVDPYYCDHTKHK